jgi:hypothetical protein
VAQLETRDIYLKGYADGREARRYCFVDRILQQPASSPGIGQPNADGGVEGAENRCTRRQGRGHDASVDNACALPKCPQPQQQERAA